MKWHDAIPGIHIIQHLPLRIGVPIPEQIDAIVKELVNPVVLIINLKSHPGQDFSHVVKGTAGANASRKAYLHNVLKKYPQTERIFQEEEKM